MYVDPLYGFWKYGQVWRVYDCKALKVAQKQHVCEYKIKHVYERTFKYERALHQFIDHCFYCFYCFWSIFIIQSCFHHGFRLEESEFTIKNELSGRVPKCSINSLFTNQNKMTSNIHQTDKLSNLSSLFTSYYCPI